MGDYLDLHALGLVVLTSLAGGVGLVALYATGIRVLALGRESGRSVVEAAGYACFALVVVAVVVGLYVLLDKG